jgi:predicted secreted protein
MKKIFLLTFVLLIVGTCGFSISSNEDLLKFSYQINSEDKIKIDYENGDFVIVNLEPNDILIVYLPANATTGYEWLLTDEIHSRYAEFISNEYEVPSSNLAGAGGTSVWKFKAVNEGLTTAALEYLRSWETDVDPVYKLMLQIQIKKREGAK